jgi:hypothetical protein
VIARAENSLAVRHGTWLKILPIQVLR